MTFPTDTNLQRISNARTMCTLVLAALISICVMPTAQAGWLQQWLAARSTATLVGVGLTFTGLTLVGGMYIYCLRTQLQGTDCNNNTAFAKVEQRLREAQAEKDQITTELETISGALTIQTILTQQAERRLREAQAEKDQITTELETISGALTTQTILTQQAKRHLREAQAEKEYKIKLQAELTAIKQWLPRAATSLYRRYQTAAVTNSTLQKQLMQAQTSLSDVEQRNDQILQELRAKNELLQSELTAAKKRYQEITEAVTALIGTCQNLQNNVNSLRQKNEILTRDATIARQAALRIYGKIRIGQSVQWGRDISWAGLEALLNPLLPSPSPSK